MKIKDEKLKKVNGGMLDAKLGCISDNSVQAYDKVVSQDYYLNGQFVGDNSLIADECELPNTNLNDTFCPRYSRAGKQNIAKAYRNNATAVRDLQDGVIKDFIK